MAEMATLLTYEDSMQKCMRKRKGFTNLVKGSTFEMFMQTVSAVKC
jgi:hypothetical protein